MIRIPIIPTSIIVHLGAPDDQGRNITVPFIEYIKNVASNEIYPNWPTDALKANILAQVSFALNRIYNEFYRSEGYNFDITSDPAYDQKFVEDRQFFETISELVDDLFNNYIVRGDQVQPLFATYCDGKITTCNGLSQWGSVELASQGKNLIEILKAYYPNDINIIYNAPVTANILTFPGFNIEAGITGSFVQILKRQLNRISDNYPAIPIISNTDEYYTLEMEKSVIAFQNIFNLPPTGIVDKATWYRIKYIYNAVKKIYSIYSEGIKEEELEVKFPDVLKKGDQAPYIEALTYYLGVIAYFDDDIPLVDETDTFTDNIENIVLIIQERNNLPETGIVDANTWLAIKRTYQETIDNLPAGYTQYANEFYPNYFLSLGMENEDVERLQQFLLIICLKYDNIPGIVINGKFDSLTERSIKVLQEQFGMPATGVVGPPTWYRIVELAQSEAK